MGTRISIQDHGPLGSWGGPRQQEDGRRLSRSWSWEGSPRAKVSLPYLSLQALLLRFGALKKLTERHAAAPKATEQMGSPWALCKLGLLISR